MVVKVDLFRRVFQEHVLVDGSDPMFFMGKQSSVDDCFQPNKELKSLFDQIKVTIT